MCARDRDVRRRIRLFRRLAIDGTVGLVVFGVPVLGRLFGRLHACVPGAEAGVEDRAAMRDRSACGGTGDPSEGAIA